MRLLYRCLLAVVFTVVLCRSDSFARNISFDVFRDGKHVRQIELYKKAGSLYIMVADIGRIYRAAPHYYPVSRKAEIRLFNSTVELFHKSEQVVINSTLKSLDVPVLIKNKKWFVSVSLITSKSFSEVARYNCVIDREGRKIKLEKRISVRKPEFLSYGDISRIVIDFDSTISYRTVKEDSSRIEYEFKNGFCGEDQEYVFEDGVFNMVVLKNSGKNARMILFLGEGAGRRQEYHYKKENYLIIDFERNEFAGKTEELKGKKAPSTLDYVALLNAGREEKVFAKKAAAVSDAGIEKSDKEIKREKISGGILTAAIAEKITDTGKKIKRGSIEIYKAVKAKRKGDNRMVVVIDAGHGGKDPGAIGYAGTREKHLNLKYAKMVAKGLKKQGYKVLMTRNDDTFVPLMKRTEFANRVNADLFISIHCNASLKRSRRGFEIYYLSRAASDPAAEATARLENAVIALEGVKKKRNRKVQEVLFSMAKNKFMNESSEMSAMIKGTVKKAVKMKGYCVKRAGFHVLKGAQMPAVLVECGYLSNKKEERLLKKKSFQVKLSGGIVKGVKIYGEKNYNEKTKKK